MKIDFEYKGQHFVQFDREMARASGVPEGIVDAAIIDAYWNLLRQKRNLLIAQSDWTVLPDAPLTSEQKTAWKAYRDALRDLPATLEAQNITPEIALNDDSYFPQKPE